MNNIPVESTKNTLSFEDFKHENGITYWWASDLMTMFGYENMAGFKKVIDRATSACLSLGINHYEHIVPEKRVEDGKEFPDFKFTRFACYLVAMNGDPKKREVAAAQAYFVEQTRKFEIYLQGAEDVDRLLYREEVKKGNISLSSAAKKAGVVDYARFQNAGYLGLYNTGIWGLKKRRGLPTDGKKVEIQDYMGRTELAANLFRITQTEEKLKKDGIHGQNDAEKTHLNVAQQVRQFVKDNTGRYPEELPIERRLLEVKKELKKGMKALETIDKKVKTKRSKST